MGTKPPPPLVSVWHEPPLKCHHVARARAGCGESFSTGWCYQPVLKSLGGFSFIIHFPLILCFPFNSFSFAGILLYYILYTLCIYINRISRRTDHIYIYHRMSHNHTIIHTYTCIYIQFFLHVASEPVAFALVPSEHDDN